MTVGYRRTTRGPDGCSVVDVRPILPDALGLLGLVLLWAGSASLASRQAPVPRLPPEAALRRRGGLRPCHQQIHDTWKGGRHSKMLQPATRGQRQG